MKWLSVDPGEDTGWALWEDDELIEVGTDKLWEFIDEVGSGLVSDERNWTRVERIVCEDWALYPWQIKSLSWDKCRTARGIGAIELLTRQRGIEFVLQPAKIKEAAISGGAQELFLKPLHENRHANDAIMHGFYFLQRQRAARIGAVGGKEAG